MLGRAEEAALIVASTMEKQTALSSVTWPADDVRAEIVRQPERVTVNRVTVGAMAGTANVRQATGSRDHSFASGRRKAIRAALASTGVGIQGEEKRRPPPKDSYQQWPMIESLWWPIQFPPLTDGKA